MTVEPYDPAKSNAPASLSFAALDSFEIALTEHEFHLGRILEFDPDATIPGPGDRLALAPDTAPPAFIAIAGSAFSYATWVRLALSCCTGTPGEALAAFLVLRARGRP